MPFEIYRSAMTAALLATVTAHPASADFIRESFSNLTTGIVEDEVIIGQLYDGLYRSFQACEADDAAACDTYAIWRGLAFDAHSASAGCVYDGTMAACDAYGSLRQQVDAAYVTVVATYPNPSYPEGTPDVPDATSLEKKATSLAMIFRRPSDNGSTSAVQCQAILPECGQYDLAKVEAAQRAFLDIIGQPVPPPADRSNALGD